jgi:mono/diheme cytochrome c family protein
MQHAFFIFLIFGLTLLIPATEGMLVEVGPESSVEQTLVMLGEEPVPHQLNPAIEGATVQRGYEIVHEGRTTRPDKGGRTARQSRHFYCTSCHNMVVEDPDLTVADPQARLNFALEKGIPFLQGTTLYGVVNRTSYYNGDYEKKYGKEQVEKARYDLREAIQLCAVGCAQGRALDDWEIESVLAYLWTLELRVEDLQLTDGEIDQVNNALNEDKGKTDKEGVAKMIRSKYLQASPATFTPPPADREKGYLLKGEANNGKAIYETSCLYCHKNGRFSFYHLGDDKLSFKHLDYHMSRYTPYSLYQVARYGTVPLFGKKSYMPQYTQEKMTDQQMEDLRAYISLLANGEGE